MKPLLVAAVALAGLALSAAAAQATPMTPANPTPTPYVTPSPPMICQTDPTTSGCPPTDIDAREAQFFALLNEYRVQSGVAPIQMRVDTLDHAARWKSTDMLVNNYFAHDDLDGRNLHQRFCDFGYCFNTFENENIAGGGCSALGAFNDWKNSSGHNATMLDPVYRVAGIGLAWVYPASISHGCDWTVDFGGTFPCGPQPTPTPPLFVCINPEGGTPSPTFTANPTPSPSPTSHSPSASSVPSASPTVTPTPTARLTPRPTPTVRPTPTHRPTPTVRVTPTKKPTSTPKPAPTLGGGI